MTTTETKQNRHSRSDLIQMQSLPLEYKIIMTKQRIRVWYESWTRFEIKNKVTGKERFEVIDTRDHFAEPKLKENEYIDKVYDGQVYVSFSGGKDSTVLLHMVREMFPDVEAVFVNTGLEYPEIQQFVKTFDNVTILRPEMRFDEVIKKYGYPMISKEISECVSQAKRSLEIGSFDTQRLRRLNGTLLDKEGNKSMFNAEKYKPLLDVDFNVTSYCCNVFKKNPSKKYEKRTGKKPILAQLAAESVKRRQGWEKTGCNAWDLDRPMSNPMAFWTEQDVLQYIKEYDLPIAKVYGDVVYKDDPEQMRFEEFENGFETGEKLATTGCDRTGCIFCGFGCHLEKQGEGRFERLKETHPRQYKYCMEGGEYDENGLWILNKQGLGMKHVFDELNEIYGDGFVNY